MDEDEHRRAEEEMKELHLRHLHQRNESQKFVNRLISTFYKALVLAIALGFLCLLPSQFATFGRYFRRAVLARTWDAVNIVLVGIAIAYGVLGRARIADPDVQENDRNRNRNRDNLYVNRFLEPGEEYSEPVYRRTDFELDSSVDVVAENVASPLVRDDGGKLKNAEVVCSNPREMPQEPLVEINRFPESPSGHRMRSVRHSISYQDLREFSRGEKDLSRRRAMDDIDLDRRNRHRSPHSASESNGFEDSPLKSIGVKDSALESNGYEDSPQIQIKSVGFEAVSDSGYQSSRKSEVINHADSHFTSVTAEAVESSENKHSLSTVDVKRGPPPPLPPPPPPTPTPPVSIIAPPQKDSNLEPPAMHYTSMKRKRKIISPPPPPPPPPRPPPALETPLPKERTRDASGHERTENPKKLEKIKSDKRNLFNLPPRPPPRPTEHGVTVNHESKPRKNRSEEDSKYRASREDEYKHRSSNEDEYKHRSSKDENKYKSAKDIASALGLLDRKHKKIPSPPTPPPPPSTLQQWWSSYKKDSKHKNKDSEPSPRPRSDKSSRKVHSSSSPPPAPPPPPPPPPTTSIIHRISKSHRKGRSSTSVPPAPPPPPPAPPTSNVDRISKPHRNGSSERNGLSKLRWDETSEIKDLSNSSKENMVGESKAEEKLARRKSLPIPLPPPPPPLPFSILDLPETKHEKKKISPPASVESESEPEPERGWAFVFRKQFSLDNGESQFCPSPSPDEVNRQADAFIANFHKQIRLQKSNSFNERLEGWRT